MVIFSVGCAEYRTERVNFDEIMKGVQTFLKKLPHEDGLPIVSSWNKVRDHIEALPRRAQRFPKMNLETLPKQQRLDLQVPEHLQSVEEINKELTGDTYEEFVEEGDLDDEIQENMDVCLYTPHKKDRPWVGRVVRLLPNQKFVIHWFCRKSPRSNIFVSMKNTNGTDFVSEEENGSIMIWQMTDNRTENSFNISNYWLEILSKEYEKLDS